jgi:uncharacterized protein DUF5412
MPPVSLEQFSRFALPSVTALVLFGFSGCNLCKDEILEKTTSPDGKWTATTLRRDCGATTSEYTSVNLQDAKKKQLDSQNEVFVTKYGHRLHIAWQSNNSLIIDCENCTADQVKKKVEKVGQIQITYR